MGRSQIEPVLENRSDYIYAPKLQWYDLFKGVEFTGQILMSVQLLQITSEEELGTVTYDTIDELANTSKDQSKNDTAGYIEELPQNLIAVTTTYKSIRLIAALFWGRSNKSSPVTMSHTKFDAPSLNLVRRLLVGLRDMSVTRKPCAVLEMDELTMKSQTISEKKANSNFPDGKASEVFEAPENELYCPPLSVRLYDSGTFGRTIFVGTNVIKNPNKYMVRWLPQEQRETSIRSSSLSIQICQGMHTRRKISEADMITIYSTNWKINLNSQKFKDWCSTFKLYSGKKTGVPDKDAQLFCGYLKAGIALYKWPPPPNTIAVSPSGVDLHKGVYEFQCSIPDDYLLTVYVYDHDIVPPDDLIGCTSIDLEDRIYTRHRATCDPLPRPRFEVTFSKQSLLKPLQPFGLAVVDDNFAQWSSIRTGANKWRDCTKPSTILKELCLKNHIPGPTFPDDSTVMVDGVKYNQPNNNNSTSSTDLREHMSRYLAQVAHFAHMQLPLVTEHIETRTLYNQEKPGLDQASLVLNSGVASLIVTRGGFEVTP
ncbi:Fer-1-like protein 6 [Eumeta japonica]|uniref:Fer-1-like protein 6 n=1 Tax=Eumeta variegata TaxID=151549 RepID=A0A4C1ZJI9_EUMVA|nr:Fer-1-like protein 6 [Eumeta japonica]